MKIKDLWNKLFGKKTKKIAELSKPPKRNTESTFSLPEPKQYPKMPAVKAPARPVAKANSSYFTPTAFTPTPVVVHSSSESPDLVTPLLIYSMLNNNSDSCHVEAHTSSQTEEVATQVAETRTEPYSYVSVEPNYTLSSDDSSSSSYDSSSSSYSD